jgi:hypothetical protein
MTEREVADFRLGQFSATGSRGLDFLRQAFPTGELTRRSMYSLATVLAALASVRLERDFARRKELLIKWFDDNLEALEPFLPFVELIA